MSSFFILAIRHFPFSISYIIQRRSAADLFNDRQRVLASADSHHEDIRRELGSRYGHAFRSEAHSEDSIESTRW